MTITFPATETVRVQGNLEVLGTKPAVARSELTQDNLQVYPIDLTAFRVWDAFHTNLPGTSAADDLGLVAGTFGTDTPAIETYDVKSAGAVTLYARCMVRLPIEYRAGETVQLRVSAGMITTVADTTATLDVEVYKSARDGTITGSELVAAAAVDINSLVFADKDFTIAAATLAPGDTLDIRLVVAVNDAAGVAVVKARLGAVELLCDVKG